MRKIFFILILSISISSIAETNQVSANADEISSVISKETDVNKQAQVPISRWWFETTPMDYQGRTYFHRRAVFGQCMEGYLGAKIVGAGYYQYVGYLYPCGGSLPIPATINSVEES